MIMLNITQYLGVCGIRCMQMYIHSTKGKTEKETIPEGGGKKLVEH